MERDRLPCDRHAEQIKTLFKRMDEMSDLRKTLHNLDKNYAVQTEILKKIQEHNERQDERMDNQEQQSKEQHEVIVKINDNLTELARGQRALNKRVGKLEKRVEENEEKHTIDKRDIDKERDINILKKWAMPVSIGIAVGMAILEAIKLFK